MIDIPPIVDQLAPEPQNSNMEKPVPRYVLIPGFNFFQLFLIGLGYLPFSNRLLGQQVKDKYDTEDLASNDFNLNNLLNESTVVNRKQQFLFLLHSFNEEEDTTDNIILNENIDYSKDLKVNESEDKIYDIKFFQRLFAKNRKKIIIQLDELQKCIAFSRDIDFVDLDTGKDQRDIIINTIQNVKSYTDKPFLFFSKGTSSQTKFPLRVLMQRNLESLLDNKTVIDILTKKYKIDSDDEKKKKSKAKEIYSQECKNYCNLSFIIGTKNGIPILLLINQSCIVKVYDNKSEMFENDESIMNSLDTIYMLYYSIDGIDCGIPLKSSISLKSKLIHGEINELTDSIFRNYLHYKAESNWDNREFNFIELLQESIIYPAFFGFCMGCDLESCFIGSVILGTDLSLKDHIINNSNSELQTNIRNFVQTYGKFTIFVGILPQFMEAVIEREDARTINKLANFLFSSIPAYNKLFFDLFIYFMKTVISRLPSKPVEFQKTLKQYLAMVVENRDNLNISDLPSNYPTYSNAFSLEQHQNNHMTPLQAYDNLKKLKDEKYAIFFTKKCKYVKDYKSEFIQPEDFTKYLSSIYYLPEIYI